MASGLLGRRNGDDGTSSAVYTCPASTLAVVNLVVCNTTSSADDIIVYVAPSGATLANVHIIEKLSLPAGGVIERTNIVLDAGSAIYVNATADTVSNVWGIEESV